MRSPRLLDQVSEAIRVRHYSLRTEEAYIHWIKRFILFHKKRHPKDMGKYEVETFLSYLATHKHVAASTQNQALSAILFLYKQVLKQDIDWIDNVIRAKRPKRVPVVLTKTEIKHLLDEMNGVYSLIANMMYGSGLRLMEVLRLRVQDVDFGYQQILIRSGKGNKDRVTVLPKTTITGLQTQMEKARKLHQADLTVGFGEVHLPHALHQKYPNAGKEWRWAALMHPCTRGIGTSMFGTLCVSIYQAINGPRNRRNSTAPSL